MVYNSQEGIYVGLSSEGYPSVLDGERVYFTDTGLHYIYYEPTDTWYVYYGEG